MTAAAPATSAETATATATETESARPAVTGDGSTAGSRAARRWRAARPALLVLLLASVVATASVLALPRASGGALDPDSAAPGGSRAVAQVLGDQGVDVRRETTVDAALTAVRDAPAGAPLVVVDSPVLPPDRLDSLARADADLVLVEPDGPVLTALAPGLAAAGVAEDAVRPAGCEVEDAAVAGSALGGGFLVRATGDGATVCFPDARDAEAGSYAVTTGDGGRQVTVLGQGGVLANGHLGDDGNAALALRTLGGSERLVWLMASPFDTAADTEATATDLLPPWVGWVALWLGVVTVLAMLWRGRRLGRLVPEPLPVVVRSAETAEGRAALYRAAGAYDRAGAVLRAAALRRIATRLGMPASADADAVVTAAARAGGLDRQRVAGVLTGPPPSDGPALVRLADDLDRLTTDLTTDLTADASTTREGVHR